MQKVGAVHFNPKIQPHLQHNDRTNSNADNIRKELSHLNECDKPASQALAEIDKLYKEAMSKLDEAKKKGKRTSKERSFHEAIFEIDETTTMQECQALADKIAELTGFRKIQISIHRDEGHFEEQEQGDKIWKPHYHAHAVFFTLDRDTGKQLARQESALNPRNLSKMQDIASEVLQMQRGEKSFKDEVYQVFLDKKANRNPNSKEIIQYKPQAPRKIQNQDDFKRFKDTERELYKKIAKKRTELALKSKKIEKARVDITKRENALNLLEIKHKQFLTNLAIESEQKKSWWRNILTFGKHNKRIESDFQEAKELFLSQAKHLELEKEQELSHYKQKLELMEKELRDYQALAHKQQIKLYQKDKEILELRKKLEKYEPQEIQKENIRDKKPQSKGFSR